MIDRIIGYDEEFDCPIYMSDVYYGDFIGYEKKDGEIILFE